MSPLQSTYTIALTSSRGLAALSSAKSRNSSPVIKQLFSLVNGKG